jgi:glyoxylase I family protein
MFASPFGGIDTTARRAAATYAAQTEFAVASAGAPAVSRVVVFEHFALNVPDSRTMAKWYGEHLGFTIVRDVGGTAHTLFLGDGTGRVVVELYHNPAAPVPPYAETHPLCFHLAVVSAQAREDRRRLEAAGARFVEEVTPPDGSVLIMMRDPWGVAVQLCQRARPF